jgi:hypothetical protein
LWEKSPSSLIKGGARSIGDLEAAAQVYESCVV